MLGVIAFDDPQTNQQSEEEVVDNPLDRVTLESVMDTYWFRTWLRTQRIKNEASLQKALSRSRTLDSLLESAPLPVISSRDEPSNSIELTGGKGIDLTGTLGCHHIDCLAKEVDGLFRHAWHYFDRINLPDQALFSIEEFKRHKNVKRLIQRLIPFVLVLQLLEKSGGHQLIRFETRTPGCFQHFEGHAREAKINQAFTNTASLVREVVDSAIIFWGLADEDGHAHLKFRLSHPFFEHTEWGNLCSLHNPLPEEVAVIREAIATTVVQKYLAELSADALAARRARTALGTTIPFYKRLLATHPSPQVEDIAFELALPISPNISVASLIKLRKTEGECFERFQVALRTAISEHIKTASSSTAAAYAREIKRDIIDPELRRIRDSLAASRAYATRSTAAGIGLGTVAATVGLVTPLNTNRIGAGLAVAGAITLGASSIKKAVDDHLAVRRDVSLSDMYFLWKAHQH